MALIRCPDCGKDISDSSATCINCGCVIQSPASEDLGCCSCAIYFIFGLIILGMTVSFLGGSSPSRSSATSPDYSAIVAAEEAKPKLKLLSFNYVVEYDDYSIVEGQVQNISDESLKNVVAVAQFYKKDGTFVKSDEALIKFNPILPGQTSPFKVTATHNPAMNSCSMDFKALMGSKINFSVESKDNDDKKDKKKKKKK